MTIIEKLVIEDNSNFVRALQVQNNHLKEQLAKQEEEIADLKARLKASFQADDITKKQELITLKINLGVALKLRHDKFIENQDAECNEDNYDVLRASIHQMFRVLRRYGIEF